MTRNIVHGNERSFLSLHLLSFIVHYLIQIVSKDLVKIWFACFSMNHGFWFIVPTIPYCWSYLENLSIQLGKWTAFLDILNGVEDQQYWMEGKYSTLHKLFEKVMMITIWSLFDDLHVISGLDKWTVEYEMDLVDSAVKSLRSLVNERCER